MGLRLAEALSLQVGDIDAGRKRVHIRRGKGHKDRLVPLPDLTLEALRALWQKHHHPKFIFPSATGSPEKIQKATTLMSRGGTQNAMKVVVAECGIKKSLYTLPETQFCNPSSRTRLKSSSHPGFAWTRQPCYDSALRSSYRCHRT